MKKPRIVQALFLALVITQSSVFTHTATAQSKEGVPKLEDLVSFAGEGLKPEKNPNLAIGKSTGTLAGKPGEILSWDKNSTIALQKEGDGLLLTIIRPSSSDPSMVTIPLGVTTKPNVAFEVSWEIKTVTENKGTPRSETNPFGGIGSSILGGKTGHALVYLGGDQFAAPDWQHQESQGPGPDYLKAVVKEPGAVVLGIDIGPGWGGEIRVKNIKVKTSVEP